MKFSVLISFLIALFASFILFFLFDNAVLNNSDLLLSGVLIFLVSFIIIFILVEKKANNILKNTNPDFNNYAINPLTILEKESMSLADERKKEAERVSQLESYRKEYIGNVAHELKTPVFNIQGYISTLIDGGLYDNDINMKYLERAEKSTNRMIQIIEDLDSISQLESGNLELYLENFDIVALFKELIEAQEMRAVKKGIVVSFRNKYNPIFVAADKTRIRQVITNLIVNSITYGKENGETKVKISELQDKVIIEISDNGIGIAKEHLPRLFERFYRIDKGRSREHGGTGLGLAIVKHLIEAHGQKIDVMSTPGAGSVFTFSLKKSTTNQ